MSQSVRDLIATIRREIMAGNVAHARVGEIASQLSALMGNVADEIRAAEMSYNVVFANCLGAEGKANRAEIKAKLTPEYARLREAEDVFKNVEAMERSLRKLQDTHIAEARALR